MKILYIEDELVKAKDVIQFLEEELDIDKLVHCRSFNSGIDELRNNMYDVILLDMSLPIYDADKVESANNEFETFGGIEILEEVYRLELNTKVIIITAFDILKDKDKEISLVQLDQELKNEFPNVYMCSIHYKLSSLEWKRTLKHEILR